MKKIIVATSGIFFLLGVTLRAEANFYVPNGDAKRCNLPSSPNNNQAWQSPNLKEDASKKCIIPASKSTCPTQSSSCRTTPPVCPTPTCPTMQPAPTCPTATCPTPKCAPAAPATITPGAPPVLYKSPICKMPVRKDQVVAIVYEGSLKNNVERILRENCWDRVIWKLPVDYRWIGTAKIAGPDLPTVMDTLLAPFPVEITFYHANHVATINQRKYHE